MSGYSVSEIQKELLVLLKVFHGICIRHGISYSLHGGTLLGAVRERGFIPWDDDADITMTRAEYERFAAVMRETELDREFYFGVFERLPKMMMLREGHPLVWIDIFIYDFISERHLSQKLKFCGIMLLGGLLKEKELMTMAKMRVEKWGDKWKYYLFYLANILGRVFSRRWKVRWFDAFCKRFFVGHRRMVNRSNDLYRGAVIVLPACVMSSYVMVPFEDTELMISSNSREILVSSYGDDYMTPQKPPQVDEVVHDLSRDYLEREFMCRGH